MTLDLPTPIDQAFLNERVQAWADALVASYQARYPYDTSAAMRYNISVERLRKYWRIVMDNGGRSVHAFVDPTTGDVLKAAGWKAPAKGVRYNLLNDTSYEQMLAAVDPFGAYLYQH
jgi:hypothetical protein